MAVITAPLLKLDDGTQNHPAVVGTFNQHDEFKVFKKVEEVFAKWNAGTSQWDISSGYVAGAQVVLLVTGHAGVTTLIDMPLEDYLSTKCCIIPIDR